MLLGVQPETRKGVDRAAGFYGCITSKRDASSPVGSRRAFARELGHDPRISMETPSWAVDLDSGPGVTVGADPTGRATVVLNGELFLEGCTDASAVAARYLRLGWGFARDLNGSFNLLLVDRVMDRVLLVTDRIASRRLFHCMTAGRHWIASDLSVLPTQRLRIDRVGVAWYLANGVAHAGRTPYDGLRALGRASIHELDGRGASSRRYWDVSTQEAGIGARDEEVAEELVRRLHLAIRRRVEDDPDLVLSLSGGWDSAALAGLLAQAVPRESVHCVSYVRGQARPGTDPWVAAKVATLLGFSHTMLESYRGDLVSHIRRNAMLGRGTAHPVDEVDAWDTLERHTASLHNPVLLVGDHYLGDNALRRAKHGRHPAGKMKEFHRLRWLAPHVGTETYRSFLHGIRADLDAVREAAGPDRQRGYYFVDQRLPNTLVPWRSQFPGRFMTVRWPLLDYDLLDWTQMTSLDQRRACIYQRTVERLFPAVFTLPRARRPGYYIDLPGECRAHGRRLRKQFLRSESRLDDVLPPNLGDVLLSRVNREARVPGRILRALRRRMDKAQVAARVRLGLTPIGPVVAPARVLRNYLILREALAVR